FGPLERPETRLLDYQAHQRKLMPRLAKTYALHFALHALRRDFVASDPMERRQVEAEAAGLKAIATWHATDCVQTGRECCGGQGYLAENRFADMKADSDVFTTFEGDNTVLLQLLAKSLLGGFKRQFGRMKPLGLVRYVAERAATTVSELNPVITRTTSDEHLLDRDFHRAAFAWREHQLVSSVARRLKARLDGEMPMAEALNECQDHLVSAARAHVDSVLLDRFDEAVRQAEDPGTVAILGRLCDLFALSRLEEDRGFFLEQGYFEGSKARAVRRLTLSLCAELRPQASHLVRSFGIPDKLLAAPIAR
ncbi:MAG: acyl-CoA dehydrogenase, partial [Acidobacteriota bacterium]